MSSAERTDPPDREPLDDWIQQAFPGPVSDTPVAPSESASDPVELLARLAHNSARGARYELGEKLGSGGMGEVIEALDADLHRPLALKRIRRDRLPVRGSPDEHARVVMLHRFLAEAQITAQLDHPGVVPVHELGADEQGEPFFTMSRVEGEDLAHVFARVRRGEPEWTLARALGVLQRVCETVAYAHSKGVVHRDLKPANVMVGPFGQVYVMDWGLARVLPTAVEELRSSIATDRQREVESDPDSPLATLPGRQMGTPAYMAPEQARGEPADGSSDVYALGAILYELLTGAHPYASSAPSSRAAVLEAVRAGPPPLLDRRAPNTPAEVAAICERAMAREPADRYANPSAMASDLRAFLEQRVVSAYEMGPWAEARKWIGRNRELAASLAAVVVAIAIGGGAFAVTAKEATDARDALARKNTELSSTNSALEKAKSEAEQKTSDVLSLSAQKDLDDLVARADKLWPADPKMIPEYEAWLKAARELIDGRPADLESGLMRRPSLAEHRAKLATLRSSAKPLVEEQGSASGESHPRYSELQMKRAELTWRSRMLGLEPWPSESEVEAQLEAEGLPSDAQALNSLAWLLVDPQKQAYGSEVRALVLARRAKAAATEAERGRVLDTLAWAYIRLGRFDEALAEEGAAVATSNANTLAQSAAALAKAVDRWRGDELSKRRDQRKELEVEVSILEREVSERHTFEYDELEAGWWDSRLAKLIEGLAALQDPKTGLMGNTLAEPFGWGVTKRYEFAKQIRERSIDGPSARNVWSEAVAAVHSSPKYGGIELTPQVGLLPIGIDPDSGLWEFAHLQSGEPAVRAADGRLAITEQTGLVFVLIPGGQYWMGAQRTDEHGRNYDSRAGSDESPVHAVTLSPYFLSKYEMTQGQWLRITARNPSEYEPSAMFNGHQHDLTHPVEQVTWTSCAEVMERLGLLLPSEAQWENGCRAGTDTTWWTGAERESLRGKINIADQSARKWGANWPALGDWPEFEDGWVAHAAVGSLAANPYGLHEVHGNVLEWCRDGYDEYAAAKQLDPVVPLGNDDNRVIRGGSFDDDASAARSAHRYRTTSEEKNSVLGLRPARELSTL